MKYPHSMSLLEKYKYLLNVLKIKLSPKYTQDFHEAKEYNVNCQKVKIRSYQLKKVLKSARFGA